MSYRFQHAMCNEAFEGRDFAEACRTLRAAGYDGIELAPFTLAEDPATLSAARRRELRDIIVSEGLRFVGLHWTMMAPKGLHATTPDRALRERSWLHVRNMVDLSADLGENSVVVFGSPQQRASTGGLTRAQATEHFVEGFAGVAPQAAERGVTVLLEPLPIGQCDVVQTLGEAVEIVKRIDHPGVRTMFDVHNAVDEKEPHAVLVDRYFDYIRHVHVNELDGAHCGRSGYDFKPVLEVLRRRNYRGWVSLEAFDFDYGAEQIAHHSLRHLEAEIEKLPS